MKLTRTRQILMAAFTLAGAFSAGAQSNGVPGDTDYSRFSQFITERNIFDPNRYPHSRSNDFGRRVRTFSPGAPTFTLVGMMTYEKGLFAFFDGNNSDLKRILTAGGSVAGYSVQDITLKNVKLSGPDKKEIVMNLGDQMREEGGKWQYVPKNDATDLAATDNRGTGTAATPTVAPSPALDANDVLKRLMQQRAQESQ